MYANYTHINITYLTLDFRYCLVDKVLKNKVQSYSDFTPNPIHSSIYLSNIITKDKWSIMLFMKTSSPSRLHGVFYVEFFVLIKRNLTKINNSGISSITALPLTQQEACTGRKMVRASVWQNISQPSDIMRSIIYVQVIMYIQSEWTFKSFKLWTGSKNLVIWLCKRHVKYSLHFFSLVYALSF